MILNEHEGELLVVTQNDHAAFAAELLSLWRADGMAEHPRREDLLFAARHHDDGWLEVDSAPRCDPRGRPYDYLSIPPAFRLELWQLGVRRHLGVGFSKSFASAPAPSPDATAYGALLIVRHARELHRDWPRKARAETEGADLAAAAWTDALEEWRTLERELAEATAAKMADIGQEQIASDYRFVSRADTLSLASCEGWSDPFELEAGAGHPRLRARQRRQGAASILELDPFPLAGSTSFRVACRTIPARTYAGDADLAVELATARWQRRSIRVVPMERL